MKNRFRVFQALVTLALVVGPTIAGAQGISGTIRNFKLDSCGKTTCLRVEAPQASVGAIDGSYASGYARVEITEKLNGSKKTFLSKDLYFDPSANKLFLRSLAGDSSSEYYFDLWTEKLVRFAL